MPIYELEERIYFDAAGAVEIGDINTEQTETQSSHELQTEFYPGDSETENHSTKNSQYYNTEAPSVPIEGDTFIANDYLKQTAFLDTNIPQLDAFIAELNNSEIDTYVFSDEKPLTTQLDDFISENEDIDAIHILSHGNTGYFSLAGEIINSENISVLSKLSNSLTSTADILLYGCNIASDDSGIEFINSLSEITKADIAASSDNTGISGDWELEISTGKIDVNHINITNYNHNLTDYLVTNTSGNPDIEGSLPWAIEQANNNEGCDQISFDSITDNTPITTDDEILITDDVVINGNGADKTIIQASDSLETADHRVFYIDDNDAENEITVEFNNLAIQNGKAPSISEENNIGGGILNSEDLTLDNVNISYNSAYRGGGIINFGTLTITDSDISYNTGNWSGGGIYNWSGYTEIVNSIISSNTAESSGGAITNAYVNAELYCINTVIENNDSEYGGGIYTQNSYSLIDNSSLINNTAKYGAGLYATNDSCTITDSIITGNTAESLGGGAYTASASCTIEDSTINENSAFAGGAIYSTSNNLTIASSNIQDNYANIFGGGICNNAGIITAQNNTAIERNTTEYNGGGIYNGVNASLNVYDASITCNTAEYGGGIYNDGLINIAQAASIIGNNALTYGSNTITGSDIPLAYLPENSTNDPYYNSLWGLKNIEASAIWNSNDDAEDIIVAVLDTGVDYTHPDLIDNMWYNSGEIPNNNIDDDNNGYIDDYWGWDFGDDDCNPMDTHSHGTHCAGIIGAVGNNGIGITGVAWNNVKIMAIKTSYDSSGGINMDTIAGAIKYAVDMGAKILSNSWRYYTDITSSVWAAFEYANDNGVLAICAAGNESIDNDIVNVYPANLDLPNIISVAASGNYPNTDNLAAFSNYGKTKVDLLAPGVEILSTVPYSINGIYYDTYEGTSMATPLVSGSAALLWSNFPSLTYTEVKSIIADGVDTYSFLKNYCASSGRLNVYNSYSLGSDIIDRPSISVIAAFNDATQTETRTSWLNEIDINSFNENSDNINITSNSYFYNQSFIDNTTLIEDGEHSIGEGKVSDILNYSELETFISDSNDLESDFFNNFQPIVSDNQIINTKGIAALNNKHPLFKTEIDLVLDMI